MCSKGHFERIGSNLVTLVYLLQKVDTPFPQQLDIPQEPIVHRLLLQPVVCSCQKERCEKQARGIARGKGKRRGTQMWTGERSPFSPSPWRIFSLTLAFPVLLVPTTVEPLHWDTSVQGTPPFKGHKNLVPEKCSHNLCNCYLYWKDTSI